MGKETEMSDDTTGKRRKTGERGDIGEQAAKERKGDKRGGEEGKGEGLKGGVGGGTAPAEMEERSSKQHHDDEGLFLFTRGEKMSPACCVRALRPQIAVPLMRDLMRRHQIPH